MKSLKLYMGLLVLVLVSAAHGTSVIKPVFNYTDPSSSFIQDGLLHNVYIYQEQPMMTANWLYIGYAPRMNDPNRIKVVISKQGFTMRVNLLMTRDEVAQYPQYLMDRSRRLDSLLANYGVQFDTQNLQYKYTNSQSKSYYLEIPQIHRLNNYKINMVKVLPGLNDGSYEAGLTLLQMFFPQNVQEKMVNGVPMVEANFVYPITITEFGLVRPLNSVFPQAKTYYTFSLDERRSEHNEYVKVNGRSTRTGRVADDLFDGFPAFWIDPDGKGTGVHGPIRYSEPSDRNGTMSEFWRDNNYLDQHNGVIDPTQGLDVNFRFEVIRTANSASCFRSEPMELRALLPAGHAELKKVPFVVIDTFDQVDGKLVDVNYYTDNHYKKADRYKWYLKHYLTFAERQLPADQQQSILEQRLEQTKIFPYLDPASLEFKFIGFGVDPHAKRRYQNGMATYRIQSRKYDEAVQAYNDHYALKPGGGFFGGNAYRQWKERAEELWAEIPQQPMAPVQPTHRAWHPMPAPNLMGKMNRAPY